MIPKTPEESEREKLAAENRGLRGHLKNLIAHFDSLFESEVELFGSGAFDQDRDSVEEARQYLNELRP